ncbi:MAG: type II toxin-antitoxin system HicA family toxin [Ignavibacteriaceae bacterium]
MAQRDREDIRKALCKKGFTEENNDHYFYIFTYQNKKTSIHTKISKGSSYKTIQQSLLSLISKQLKLTNGELLDFVDCHLQIEDYLKILANKNIKF